MIYAKWIVLFYIIIFDISFIYRNLKTKKKTGLPVKAKNGGAKMATIFSFLIFVVALVSLFIQNCYRVFIPISFLHSELSTIAGYILLIISLIIGIISAKELGASWRVGIFGDQRTTLVKSGIYKFCRNPYFLSYYIMFLAFLLITPSVLLLILLMVSIYYFHQMIKSEEKHLEKVHGSEYLDYLQKTGRYFFKLGRGK